MVVAFYFRLHLAYFPRPVVAIFARPEHRPMFQLCACHSDTPQYNSSETFRNVPLLLSHVCPAALSFDGYDDLSGFFMFCYIGLMCQNHHRCCCHRYALRISL